MLFLRTIWIILILNSSSSANSQFTYEWHDFPAAISKYLKFYHDDFARLKIDIIEKTSSIQLLIRASDSTLLTRIDLDINHIERSLFEAVASLYISPDKTDLPSHQIPQIISAWFWDYKSWKNPAYLDFLAEQFLSLGLVQPDHRESVGFWKYQMLLHRYGGRRQLWEALQHDPSIINDLNPESAIPPQELVNLIAYITQTASPVQTPNESRLFLSSLETFPIWTNGNLQSRQLSELSDLTLISPEMKRAYRIQIQRIKIQLTNINPLFLNPIRSIGVSYEALLRNDLAGFREAFSCFENDKCFAIQIYEEIK